MSCAKRLIATTLLALPFLMGSTLAPRNAAGQDPQAEPPVPAFLSFPARTSFATGQVQIMYLADAPNFYFSLSSMPEKVDYFRVRMNDDMAERQRQMVMKAAEQGWTVGVYHQQRTTQNQVDVVYLVTLVSR